MARLNPVRELRRHLRLRFALPDAEPGPQQAADRPVGGPRIVRRRPGGQHGPIRRHHRVEELVHEARLSDPRLAHDGDHLAAARLRAPERPSEALLLRVPAEEAGQAAGGADVPPRPRRRPPVQGIEPDGALDGLRPIAERGDVDEALRAPRRVGRQCRAAGRRQRRDPPRQPDHGAHGLDAGGVIGACRRPDYHLAGMESDPQGDAHWTAAAAAAQRLLHGQRGEAGAHGVVLMGHRGAEHRRDAVGLHRCHAAVVAVDRIAYRLQAGGEAADGELGVGRVLLVVRLRERGDQDGHVLALGRRRNRRCADLRSFDAARRDSLHRRLRATRVGAAPSAGGSARRRAARTRARSSRRSKGLVT